jgi:hypothetical protein
MAQRKTIIRKIFDWLWGTDEPTKIDGGIYDGGTIDPQRNTIMDGVMYTTPPVMPSVIRSASPAVQRAFMEASDPFRAQMGTPYSTGSNFLEIGYSDPLCEWDYSTRRYILEQCHLAWERNPLAKSAIQTIRMFTVQNGFSINYRNNQVKDILEGFIDDEQNNVAANDKAFLETLLIDGELFLRKARSGGRLVIAPIPAWGIREIQCNPSNVHDIYQYHYLLTTNDGVNTTVTHDEWIPVEDILHAAINRLPYEQRGRPDIFNVLPWLRAYKNWIEDRARQNAFRGAIYDVTVQTNNASHLAAVLSRYRKPMMSGTVNVHSDKEQFSVMPQDVRAGDAAEDGRQIKLMSAVGMGLPEYFLSDGSNANLASATAQQLPALRRFGEYQDIMKECVWMPILREQIAVAIDAGMLPEYVEEQRADGTPVAGAEPIDAMDAFDIIYPELEGTDPAALLNSLMMAVNAGLISEQTATGLMPWPVDYAVEQERIEAERQGSLGSMQNFPVPPAQPEGPEQPDDEQTGTSDVDIDDQDDD